MAIDLGAPGSRRALLAAALGAVAATAAQALGRPNAALATDGQPTLQGVINSGTQVTVVKSTSSALEGWTTAANQAGLIGQASAESGFGTVGVEGITHSPAGVGVRATGPRKAVYGEAGSGGGTAIGVHGVAVNPTGVGVRGDGIDPDFTARGILGRTSTGTGVHGFTGIAEQPPSPAGNVGVHGESTVNSNSVGVRGVSPAGAGVYGLTTTGVALRGVASDPAGVALSVTGRTTFSRSGKATVLNGQNQVIVTNVPLTSASLVLATIQGAGESGLYVRNVTVSVANSQFTIRLSKAVSANRPVAWFVVN